MSISTKFFKVVPVSRQKVAKVGKTALFENIIRLVRAADDTPNELRVNVNYEHLLPAPGVDESNGPVYISTHEAHERTGIPLKTLQKLCRSGVLYAVKDGGGWLILLESLMKLRLKPTSTNVGNE